MSHNLNILLSFFFACLDIFFGRRRSIYTLIFDHKLCVHIYPMGRRGECRRIGKFNIFGDIHKRSSDICKSVASKWGSKNKNWSDWKWRMKELQGKSILMWSAWLTCYHRLLRWTLLHCESWVLVRDLVHHPRQIYIASFARAANGDDSWIKVRIIINSWTLKMRIKHIN